MIDKEITFKELSEIWLKKSTACVCYGYKQNLYSYVQHCNQYLSDKKIKEIKSWDIDEIIYNLARNNPNTNKPSSKKFLEQLINCLQRIFDFAIENELIYRNPAKNKKKEIPKTAPKKIIEPLTAEQRQLVIDVEHRAKTSAVLMMFTGLRTGELLALEWQDIDIDRLKLSINKRAQRTGSNTYTVIPGTKNGKTRCISIPSNLGMWLKNKKIGATSYLVCPNLDNKLQTPSQWKRLWQSYQKKINYCCYKKICSKNNKKQYNYYSPYKIPKVISSFNPHQLRHTYATLLYISGVDVLTAKDLLGHSNIETTLKIYTHLDEKFRELNISKFDNYIKTDFNIKNI